MTRNLRIGWISVTPQSFRELVGDLALWTSLLCQLHWGLQRASKAGRRRNLWETQSCPAPSFGWIWVDDCLGVSCWFRESIPSKGMGVPGAPWLRLNGKGRHWISRICQSMCLSMPELLMDAACSPHCQLLCIANCLAEWRELAWLFNRIEEQRLSYFVLFTAFYAFF